ncbi:AfsR/SARP family transcriptional regulator [Streptomyces sp. NPDC020707]|uniref:AfsR/SARP family transcriptional regulator n=1 Tax=Streptomyces sp. NPDC020707 TaxID=3365084 RepID=UPI0037B21117
MIRLRLLGPVELVAGERGVEIGPPQRRAVLAALAVDAGRPVTADVLIRRVWGTSPPDGARRALHAHIARLRRLCEQTTNDGGDVQLCLVRRSGGYLLEAEADQVDVLRFRLLAGQGRETGRTDDDRAALLHEALRLWHGDPLADVGGQWAERVREAWRRQYVDITVGWAAVESRIGDPVTVIGPLTDLLDEFPLVEPLAETLMRALHAAGRGAEALDRFATLRRRLAEELGADPGPGLREAHRAILRGNPPASARRTAHRQTYEPASHGSLPARPEPEPSPGPSPVTGRWPGALPAQLPMGVRSFTGRADELAQLDMILASTAVQPSAVVISALSGTAGVGKTALAVHWARRAQTAFPDGQLYVNLRGFGSAAAVMSPAEAVRGFLDAFGVPPARVPVGLEAQTGLYRSLLAGRRVLVVLDNARDAEQVRPLLPGAPGCLALVTSRRLLTGLAVAEGAHLLTVDLLTSGQARELLTGRLGVSRTSAEGAAVGEIVGRCAGLPLALAIVGARAAARPRFPLATLAEELRRAENRLDALDGGEVTSQVRAVFSWSYEALSPGAARLFRLLGVHPGPDAALPAIAALAGIPVSRAVALLAELVDGHLLTEHAPGRYTFHDLLRAYAVELVDAIDSDLERHTALHRLLDHYLHTAHTADVLLTPQPNPVPLPPAGPGAAPETLADHEQSQAWFAAEHTVLVAVAEQADARGFDRHSWQLAASLTTFLDRHGYWRVLAALQTSALKAARRQGDRAGQAGAHRGLGLALDRLGRGQDARGHYLLALDLFAELGSDAGQARTHQHLARMSAAQGSPQRALDHAGHSLRHYRAAADRAGQSAALNHIGWLSAQLGEHHEALGHCRQALDLAEETGDLNGQAHTWDSLGYIQHRLGRHAGAVDCYRRAVDLFHRTGERQSEAAGLLCLGDIHRVTDRPDAARTAWTRALTITDELALPDLDPLRTELLTRLDVRTGPAAEQREQPPRSAVRAVPVRAVPETSAP